MILGDAIKEAFGYYDSELLLHSHKPILVTCEYCGKFRLIEKRQYRTFCKSCIIKITPPALGCIRSKETKAKISAARLGKYVGEKNPNYNGGKELAGKRHSASRRQLGYSPLLSLTEGEVGHHITDVYVIGIPKEAHNNIGGNREKHRAKVLEWLKVNDKRKYYDRRY
jgi:hypothetical protein